MKKTESGTAPKNEKRTSYRSVYQGAGSTCWRKIADHYREEITSGRLPPGSSLPSTQILAKEYETSVYSVQYALAALSHEGLIIRRPHYGTIVNGVNPELKTVGIFIFVKDESGFDAHRRILAARLAVELKKKGCQALLLIEDESGNDLAERVRSSVRKLEIQAIILFSCSEKTMNIFRKINIPFITDAPFPVAAKGIYNPRYELPPLAVNALAQRKCVKPALIASFTDKGLTGKGWLDRDKIRFFEEYETAVTNAGMEFSEERIFRMESGKTMTPPEQIEYGYSMFHRLWKQKNHPDSLIVFTDGLLPGIILAMAELGVKSPQELLIAQHYNSISEIFVPFETIKIEVDVIDEVNAFIEKIFHEFQRLPSVKTLIHYKLRS